MKLSLNSGWVKNLEERQTQIQNETPIIIKPTHLPTLCSETIVINSDNAAADMLLELKKHPVAAIAWDSEFTYHKNPISERGKNKLFDPKSQRPLLISLAAWVQSPTESLVLKYVIQIESFDSYEFIEKITRLRVPHIFHNIKAELFTLWSLGIATEFQTIYDTYLAAACIHLGDHHHRAKENSSLRDESDVIINKNNSDFKREHQLSLIGQCHEYKIEHKFHLKKNTLQSQFLNTTGVEFSNEQIEYAAEDAYVTLQLYVAQQTNILKNGLHHHLHTIEFPFSVANAKVEWNGVNVSRQDILKLHSACEKAVKHHSTLLQKYGITNSSSRKEFQKLLIALNLDHYFTEKTIHGNIVTDDQTLKNLENLHPCIKSFRAVQKYKQQATDALKWLSLICGDGRLHPINKQLGTHTGRNTCSSPNIAGLSRVFRPIVKATPGRAIFEADFSQVEVAVAAAEFADSKLVSYYNSADLYTHIASLFYSNELSNAPPDEVAALKKKYRNQMKIFVLAVMYNMQAPSVALLLNITTKEARKEIDRFLNLFPDLKIALEEASVFGNLKGYATTVSGLRRHIQKGSPSQWVNNFLRNTPIQGSAADVFKAAVVNVERGLSGTSAKIILLIHDAVVIECDVAELNTVSESVRFLMSHTLRAFYPNLSGKVDINKIEPSCWNKDGHADSLDKFLLDPAFNIDEPSPNKIVKATQPQ